MDPPVRRRLVVRGTVQGVGFRPWAVRRAAQLDLTGHVTNDGGDVVVEVQGAVAAVEAFTVAVCSSHPPLARVEAVDVAAVPEVTGEAGFAVRASEHRRAPAVAVPADVATCDACLRDVADPTNRRYRYPFTNCTDCGPRYTIIRSLPYDRASTTMAAFALCAACRGEYDDPRDRRFRAEPVACPRCGPTLTWEGPPGAASALDAAVACLASGGIVAVKGIGGYHLACRAGDEHAVSELRRRKKRDEKPFAVMVATLDDARSLVDLTDDARAALVSPRRPIVIAPRVVGSAAVADGVAPGSRDLGVMLPYSPLHHLLVQGVGTALVMTSGNRADEPIAHTIDAARQQLGDIADGFLHHDRPIEVRCDDSVVRSNREQLQVVRRSRGYAPEPLRLPGRPGGEILAVGAQLKSTVAVTSGGSVVASHHLGDLEHPAAFAAFEQAAAHLRSLTGIRPSAIAHDLHPEYLSTKWALEQDLPVHGIQHHHAHVASCLVDNDHPGPVVGLALDGLGFGTDGNLWGGEILLADLRGSQRLAHLRTVALPGGAAAVREPWRMGLVWAATAAGADVADAVGAELDPRWNAVLSLASSPATPVTSSAGRLFDAVASLAGGRRTISFEGQAAMELEAAAWAALEGDGESGGSWVTEPDTHPWVLDPSSLVRDVLRRRREGLAYAAIARAFHEDLAAGLVRAGVTLARREGIGVVALTGGVFQNMLLTRLVGDGLRAVGLDVLVHHRVPANDGGISIGQAAIACALSGGVAA